MRLFKRSTTTCAAVAAVLAYGCGESASVQPVSTAPAAAASFDIVSGNAQNGPAGGELAQPLVMRALDAGGNPVAGQVVNFRVTRGGGSVFAGSAQTSVDGYAREWWTLGTVAGDTQRVEARSVDPVSGEKRVYAVFAANAVAAAPVRVERVGPLGGAVGQVGSTVQDTFKVRLRDRYGNVATAAGLPITWTPSGNGRVSQSPTFTDAAGVASVRWAFSTVAGAQTLVASHPGAQPETFTGQANPRAVKTVQVTPDSVQFTATGQVVALSVVVRDEYGNVLSHNAAVSTNTSVAAIQTVYPVAIRSVGSGRALIVVTAGSKADTAVARVP